MAAADVDRELADMACEHATAARAESVQGARDFAATIAAFRSQLLEDGVPQVLADDLTREWGDSLIWRPGRDEDDEDQDD